MIRAQLDLKLKNKKKIKCCFKGLEPLFRGPIQLQKFLCRTTAPEQLNSAQLNLKIRKKKSALKVRGPITL